MSRQRNLFGITGTPGTGKKSIARFMAKKLGLPARSINDVALATGEGTDVDTQRFKARLSRLLQGPALVYGHLLPYSLDATLVKKVVVLRCEPSVLKKRLEKRGYSGAKLAENVEAELIGLIYFDSLSAFGPKRVEEFDTTRADVNDAALTVASMLTGKKSGFPRVDWVGAYDSPKKLRALLGGRDELSAFTRTKIGL